MSRNSIRFFGLTGAAMALAACSQQPTAPQQIAYTCTGGAIPAITATYPTSDTANLVIQSEDSRSLHTLRQTASGSGVRYTDSRDIPQSGDLVWHTKGNSGTLFLLTPVSGTLRENSIATCLTPV